MLDKGGDVTLRCIHRHLLLQTESLKLKSSPPPSLPCNSGPLYQNMKRREERIEWVEEEIVLRRP